MRTIRIPDSSVGNPELLVALPSLGSRLLLDAPYVDLPDKCFRDEVEGVNLLLHLNIANLQWMVWEKEIVVRCNKSAPSLFQRPELSPRALHQSEMRF